MGVANSTGERLRRATQLWHSYLASTGKRFELAQFLRDEAFEKQILEIALASKDAKLVKLAQDWLRDPGQPAPAVVATRAAPTAPSVSAAVSPDDPPKAARYLRGVR